MKELTVNDKNSGQRIDKYLKKIMVSCPTNVLYKSFRKKNITLNDKKCTGNETLKPGDIIKVFFSDETYDNFASKNNDNKFAMSDSMDKKNTKTTGSKEQVKDLRSLDISVVYEDDDYIFLNKAAGILCQNATRTDISLNDWVRDYLKTNKELDYSLYKPSCVNRIDRNTSGLVMCAKTYKGSRILSDLISGHKLKKVYRAVCHGVINEELILTGFHYKDEKRNISKVCNSLSDVPAAYKDDAKRIDTIVTPVKNNGVFTLLDIQIITGKSHQIRTHLASIRHPLCGDIKYGGTPYKGKRYQMLHAMSVSFPEDDNIGTLSGRTIEAVVPNIFRI